MSHLTTFLAHQGHATSETVTHVLSHWEHLALAFGLGLLFGLWRQLPSVLALPAAISGLATLALVHLQTDWSMPAHAGWALGTGAVITCVAGATACLLARIQRRPAVVPADG